MIQRSISMPVKPRYIDDPPRLERSEEKEELFIEEDYSETTKDLQDFELPRENLGDESQDKLHKASFYLSEPSDISAASSSGKTEHEISDEKPKPINVAQNTLSREDIKE